MAFFSGVTFPQYPAQWRIWFSLAGSAAATTSMYPVIKAVANLEIVGIRMANTTWANTFHNTPVISPILREINHMVIGRFMDTAYFSHTIFSFMHQQFLIGA